MRVRVSAWEKILKEVSSLWPRHYSTKETMDISPQHPWLIYPAFNERMEFGLRFNEGFVNGSSAHILVVYKNAPPATVKRIEDEAGMGGPPIPEAEDIVQSYLHEGPFLAPLWREVDPQNPNEPLPPILSSMGNIGAKVVATDVLLSTFTTYSFSVAEYTPTDFGTVVNINVGYKVVRESGFEVTCQPNFLPSQYQLNAADIFFNRYSENPVSQIKLSTVYAIRPDSSIKPAPSWKFGVDYDVHYNLSFTENQLPPAVQSQPITFITPLGLGLINSAAYLASNNQASIDALSFIAPRRTSAFWHVA